MAKITHFYIGGYSSRIKIKKRVRRIIVLIAIAVIYFLCSYIMERNVYPVVMEVAESQTEYIGETIVNSAVLQYMESKDIQYTDLYNITRGDNGKITGIEENTYEINRLKSSLALVIQEAINASDDMYITVPALCFTGNLFLSNLGPEIEISLLLSGDNATNIKSEFISSGINQTRHNVYVEFSYIIKAIIPGRRVETASTCVVPLINTIIIGDVPETIVNINKE